MFTDTEKELNTVTDNLTNFAKALVEFVEKVMAFFKTLGDLFAKEEEAEG